jgi:cell pole-organizing protein PopZ
MPDKKPDQEPSIEEILASIRQIISDDDGAAASAPASPPPAPDPPPPPANDDIIDLTEKADPPTESFPTFLEQASADSLEEENLAPPIVDVTLKDHVEEDPPFMPPPSDSLDFDDSPSTSTDDSALLTDRAAGAALAAFSKLSGSMPIRRSDSPGEGTLEDIVRDMLRPMLRTWLDDNLPPIIERLVRRELEKISRQAAED